MIEGEMASTGIPTGSMDFVLMANVFHDADKDSGLTEIERILKREGMIVILDWKKIQTREGPPRLDLSRTSC